MEIKRAVYKLLLFQTTDKKYDLIYVQRKCLRKYLNKIIIIYFKHGS